MDYGKAPKALIKPLAWIAKHEGKMSMYLNGESHQPSGCEFFESRNPSNGRTLAQIPQATQEDVDLAVKSARDAQTAWENLVEPARAKHLYALARLVQKYSRLFAVLESMDNGKPIRESRDIDAPLVARHFYYHAGAAQLMDKEMADHRAIGVAGQVIPEFSTPDACLENRPRSRHGKYGGAQACRIHFAHRFVVWRNMSRSGSSQGRGQPHHRRWTCR